MQYVQNVDCKISVNKQSLLIIKDGNKFDERCWSWAQDVSSYNYAYSSILWQEYNEIHATREIEIKLPR